MYVDGVEIGSTVPTVALGINDLFIGHDDPTKNHKTEYKGIRIYSRALTASEVKANSDADKTQPEPNTQTGDFSSIFIMAVMVFAFAVVVKHRKLSVE